jgi:hypothetical protein
MRDNLDPTGAATDDMMWRALEQTRLKEHVQSMVRSLFGAVRQRLTSEIRTDSSMPGSMRAAATYRAASGS